MTFVLGLDHVPKTTSDWFGDVAAIIAFLQPIARETGSKFVLEFRLSSRLWYMETLDFITDEPDASVDLAGIHTMLEHFTRQQRSWWQRLISRWHEEP